MRHWPRWILGVALFSAGAAVAASAQSWQDVIRNLRHPDPARRIQSIEALDNAAYTPAAEAVSSLLSDPQDRVQQAALDAELTFFLSERLSGGRVMGLGSARSRAQQAFESGPLLRGAAKAPDVVLDRLLAAIRDENPRVSFDAVHAFGFIAERPVSDRHAAALAAELDHYDPIIRAATARVLARLRVSGADDKLVAALGDSSALVRRYAIQAVGTVRTGQALSVIREMATNGRGDLVPDAVTALARFGAAEDVPLFRQWVTHRQPAMRRAGAEGLGRAADRESIETLRRLLDDQSRSVQAAAAFALQLLGDTQSHVIASLLALREDLPETADYLFDLGSAALPGIQSALGVATDARHRADLIQFLGYLGTREHIATLETFLKERDDRVRQAATHAIGRLQR